MNHTNLWSSANTNLWITQIYELYKSHNLCIKQIYESDNLCITQSYQSHELHIIPILYKFMNHVNV